MGCCFEKYIPIKLVVAYFSLSRKQSCEGKTECQATNLGAVNVPFKWPNPYTLQEHVNTHIHAWVRCMYIKIRNDKMLGLNLYLSDLAEIVGFWIAIFSMQKLLSFALHLTDSPALSLCVAVILIHSLAPVSHLNKIYFQFAIFKLNWYFYLLRKCSVV